MRNTVVRRAKKEDIFYINQKSEEKNIFNIQMCGITYPDKNYEIERRHSNVMCIEYIEKGCGTVHICDETFYPVEGDAYMLHLDFDHHYYSDEINPWKKIFINLSGNLAESLVEGYQLNKCYHFKNLNIKNELYSIIDIARKNSGGTEEIICIINRIFMKMRNAVYPKNNLPEIAEKMKEYLNQNLMNKFKVEDLCRFVSRSESQTIKIFKNAYGVTPYAYVIDKKIKLAKDMLINTSLSIKEIAYNLSFTDEYYFSNVFKSRTGQSPSAYRKGKGTVKNP